MKFCENFGIFLKKNTDSMRFCENFGVPQKRCPWMSLRQKKCPWMSLWQKKHQKTFKSEISKVHVKGCNGKKRNKKRKTISHWFAKVKFHCCGVVMFLGGKKGKEKGKT